MYEYKSLYEDIRNCYEYLCVITCIFTWNKGGIVKRGELIFFTFLKCYFTPRKENTF